jgi:hypothetical protein
MMLHPLKIVRCRELLPIGCQWQRAFFHHSDCMAGSEFCSGEAILNFGAGGLWSNERSSERHGRMVLV